jgi:hypothetical protein
MGSRAEENAVINNTSAANIAQDNARCFAVFLIARAISRNEIPRPTSSASTPPEVFRDHNTSSCLVNPKIRAMLGSLDRLARRDVSFRCV